MKRASLMGLAAGALCATVAVVSVVAIEPAPEPAPPRTTYLALGGDMVHLAADNHGPGCFVPMLDELRRRPRWTIRIDDLEWDDVVGNEPDLRHASLVIDAGSATWRDGLQPHTMALTAAERRDALAAFSLDCRADETLDHGYGGHYFGVALGEDGPVAARFPSRSPIATRLRALLEAIGARYFAGRVDDLRGFSIELAGIWRETRDDRGRAVYGPHRIELRAQDLPPPSNAYELESRVRLLDWALAQPTSLPAGKHVARGTLRAHGTSRPIAVDLLTLGTWHQHGAFGELGVWASIARSPDDDS